MHPRRANVSLRHSSPLHVVISSVCAEPNEPVRGPVLKTTPTVLSVYVVLDAAKIASGTRAATGSQIEDIMK